MLHGVPGYYIANAEAFNGDIVRSTSELSLVTTKVKCRTSVAEQISIRGIVVPSKGCLEISYNDPGNKGDRLLGLPAMEGVSILLTDDKCFF